MKNSKHILNGNPAQRLYDILDQLHKSPTNIQCRRVWAEVFEVSSHLEIHEKLGSFIRLAIEAHDSICKEFPSQKTAADIWLKEIETAFSSHSMNTEFLHFRGHLTVTSLHLLGAAAELLNERDPAVLTTIFIDETIEECSAIIEALNESDIDLHVKQYLLKSLTSLIYNLRNYKIGGPLPIMNAADQLAGHMLFDQGYREAILKTPIGERISTVMQNIANVVTVFGPVAPLLYAETAKLLG